MYKLEIIINLAHALSKSFSMDIYRLDILYDYDSDTYRGRLLLKDAIGQFIICDDGTISRGGE